MTESFIENRCLYFEKQFRLLADQVAPVSPDRDDPEDGPIFSPEEAMDMMNELVREMTVNTIYEDASDDIINDVIANTHDFGAASWYELRRLIAGPIMLVECKQWLGLMETFAKLVPRRFIVGTIPVTVIKVQEEV